MANFTTTQFNGGAFGNARGSITFLGGVAIGTGAGSTALEDFFAGDPFKASVQVGDPTLHIHNWAYGLFLQDDWRATKNLTVNLGVRYEFSSVIKEQHNLLGNFDPNSAHRIDSGGTERRQRSLQPRSQELRARASALPGT